MTPPGRENFTGSEAEAGKPTGIVLTGVAAAGPGIAGAAALEAGLTGTEVGGAVEFAAVTISGAGFPQAVQKRAASSRLFPQFAQYTIIRLPVAVSSSGKFRWDFPTARML